MPTALAGDGPADCEVGVAALSGRRGATGGGTSGDNCAFLSLSTAAGRGGVGSELGRVGGVSTGRRWGGEGLLHGAGGGGRVNVRPVLPGGSTAGLPVLLLLPVVLLLVVVASM